MTIQRMEHPGIVVDDLAAATAVGWTAWWGSRASGIGRHGGDPGRPRTARADEVSHPRAGAGDPHAPAYTPGIRHVAFAVDDIDAVVASLRARGAELVGEAERYEER